MQRYTDKHTSSLSYTDILIRNLLRGRWHCQWDVEFHPLSFLKLLYLSIMRNVLSLPLFSGILRAISVENVAKPLEQQLDGIRLQALAPSNFPSNATKWAAPLCHNVYIVFARPPVQVRIISNGKEFECCAYLQMFVARMCRSRRVAVLTAIAASFWISLPLCRHSHPEMLRVSFLRQIWCESFW